MAELIVPLARRVSRQLELGKGMFFQPEALAELARCGVVEMMSRVAAESQREDAIRFRKERAHVEAERWLPPADRRVPGARGVTPSESGKEALARALQMTGTPQNRSTDAMKKAKERPSVRLVASQTELWPREEGRHIEAPVVVTPELSEGQLALQRAQRMLEASPSERRSAKDRVSRAIRPPRARQPKQSAS